MYGSRWLPAVLVALATSVVMPDAQAQTWLRWSKATPVKDPAKESAAAKRQATIVPTVASIESRRTTPIVAPAVEPTPEPKQAPVRRGPSITIIEEKRAEEKRGEEKRPAPPVVASVTPPAPSLPPPVAPPTPPSSPPVPVFEAQREPAVATPAVLEDVAVQSAPLVAASETAAAPPKTCSDCPSREELGAISAAPAAGDAAPEDQKLQSELKRRLLLGQ